MSRCLGKGLIKNTSIAVYNTSGIADKVFRKIGVQNVAFGSLSKTQVLCSSYKKGTLGHTSILLQHGLEIQELPVIVRKAQEADMVLMCKNENNRSSEILNNISNDIESEEMINGFQRCYTTKGVFTLLDLIPANEVTPGVALQALKTIIKLETNKEFRNQLHPIIPEEKPENFTRTAVFNNLIDLITTSNDTDIILDGLRVVSRDLVGGNVSVYRQKLCDEVLIRVTDGKMNVVQVCEAIRSFKVLGSKDIDKLWVGILEKQNDIDETTIMDIFRILSHVMISRRLILNILEQKMNDFWWKLQSKDIAEILILLNSSKCTSQIIINYISRWINTNIHTILEEDLLCIIKSCLELDHSEQGVEKALERYVKAKGLKIKNPEVFAKIMDYCKKFHFRSALIFDGCSEYFVMNAKNFSPVVLKSVFYTFGYLDFHPTNGMKFWKVMEFELSERFVQLCPEDALDIMLGCIFLEKFPLNFIKKIFNPYFLDRLHSSKDPNLLKSLRAKLKLFDTAMTLECEMYRGPLLPRDHSAKSIWQDGRIKRMANYITEVFNNMFETDNSVSTCVILNQLPLVDLYVIDVLLQPKNISNILSLKFTNIDNSNIAVLINVPEHYDSTGQHLIGPQIMRRRHFRHLGMKVINVNYKNLAKLKVHPKDLEEYLIQKINDDSSII